jgi:UDP-N-acetylglucosamine diphosphorylase/glucosamine-1-phosphate N-acetyltransferase
MRRTKGPGDIMSLSICFFEDRKYGQFFPLTYLRPVCALRAGIVPLFRRVDRYFGGAIVSLATRSQISAVTADSVKECPVNFIRRDEGEVLFLNGRIRDYGDLPDLVRQSRISTVFACGHEVAGVLFKENLARSLPSLATPDSYMTLYDGSRDEIPTSATTATLYGYPFEIMADIKREIQADFDFLKPSLVAPRGLRLHEGVWFVNEDNVYLGDDVTIYPKVVINAERGPVYIGANTVIEPDATINGPAFIGPNSTILAGKLSTSSIGHTCRVGGEVEESVFHAYVNKYHAGFIGHSYVAPWVNFGAMTTNSDLKNNYSEIRVMVAGHNVNTGLKKVGSVLGDHTKFGIGTLLNTGINIGVCCNLFGGSLIADKEVPSFTWGSSGHWETYRFDQAIETARKTAERRNVAVSESEVEVLRAVSEGNVSEKGVLEFAGHR